jgi:hypothetical protein
MHGDIEVVKKVKCKFKKKYVEIKTNLCEVYKFQSMQLPWLEMRSILTKIWVIIHAFKTQTCKVPWLQQSDISRGY